MESKEKIDPEEAFRSALKDVIPICEKLRTHCASIEEMLGAVKAALENDAVLRILMKEFLGAGARR